MVATEKWIVGVIVLGAVLFIGLRLWKCWTRGGCDSCNSGCCNCHEESRHISANKHGEEGTEENGRQKP